MVYDDADDDPGPVIVRRAAYDAGMKLEQDLEPRRSFAISRVMTAAMLGDDAFQIELADPAEQVPPADLHVFGVHHAGCFPA
jgi:hypothetical protein